MRPICLFFVIFCFTIASSFSQKKTEIVDFDNYSNQQYASHLESDGWNVELLNTGHNADYLSDEEKNLVLAMNILRHDPGKFSELYVVPRFQYYDNDLFRFPGKIPIRTSEGLKAAKELDRVLRKTKPLPIFQPSEGMSKASADHANYMKKKGTTSHAGQGGMSKRISRYGEWQGSIAENLSWGMSNAHEAIISLLIDDGIPSRGHRINLLNPVYQKVGVSVKEHPTFRVSYVINYATNYVEE